MKETTLEEIIDQLENAENYNTIRANIPDQFVDYIKDMLPCEYEKIMEKKCTIF